LKNQPLAGRERRSIRVTDTILLVVAQADRGFHHVGGSADRRLDPPTNSRVPMRERVGIGGFCNCASI